MGENSGIHNSRGTTKSFERLKKETKGPTVGEAAVKGVRNYLRDRGPLEVEKIVIEYGKSLELSDISLQSVCEYIQKDFGTFVKFVKANYKKP